MEECDVSPAPAGVSAAQEIMLEMLKGKETRPTTPPSGPGGDSSQLSDVVVEDLEDDAVPTNGALSDHQESDDSAQMLAHFVSEIVHAAQDEVCRRELAFLSVKDDGESFESAESDLETQTSASTSFDSTTEDAGAVAFPRKRIRNFKNEEEFWEWEQVVVREIEEEFRAERGVDVATQPLTREEDREIRKRIIEELYGKDFPIDIEILVEFVYTTLPAMFRKAAWFDARYAQIEVNDPQVDVDVSLFIVPHGRFRDKTSLPKPFTDIHTVEEQRKKREELLGLACSWRRELENHFFSVADTYALPRFWQQPLANFDRLIYVLQRKVEDAKTLPGEMLTKPAVQQELREVAAEVDNILVEAVDTDFKCLLCREILNRAMGLTGCGHVFCSSCLDQWLTTTTEFCPTCKEGVNVEKDLQPVLRFTWLWLDEEPRSGEDQLMCDECKMSLCYACAQRNASMEAFVRWLEINNMDLETAAQICAEVENMRLARRSRRSSI